MQSEKPSQTLQQELQHAIGTAHSHLNHLLTSRLPFALPPHTDNPFLYAQGFAVVRHLYTGFEHAWETVLNQTEKPPQYLNDLRTDGITRHLRLSRDVHDLSHLLGTKRTAKIEKLMGDTIYFHKNTFRLCTSKPHMILAYSWTLYLAIFNGGRYIRAALEEAGDDFWGTEDYPLEFWNFEGEEDGNDIERAFKSNFDAAALELTRAEKDEVVAEAKRIFALVEQMVHVLDKKVARSDSYTAAHTDSAIGAVLSQLCAGLSLVFGSCLTSREDSPPLLSPHECEIVHRLSAVEEADSRTPRIAISHQAVHEAHSHDLKSPSSLENPLQVDPMATHQHTKASEGLMVKTDAPEKSVVPLKDSSSASIAAKACACKKAGPGADHYIPYEGTTPYCSVAYYSVQLRSLDETNRQRLGMPRLSKEAMTAESKPDSP